MLCTKVTQHYPFLMGEVFTKFVNRKHLIQVLRSSCHVPLVAGPASLCHTIDVTANALACDPCCHLSALGFIGIAEVQRQSG